METTLLKSVFIFQRGRIQYSVEFNNIRKRWYVYECDDSDNIVGPPLHEMPWDGVRILPTADDAETILHEYLKIDT